MTADSKLNQFLASGDNADRLLFTPTPPSPASGPDPGYFWYETDTDDTYAWNAGTAAWVKVNTTAGALLIANNLSDVANVTTAQQSLNLEPGVDVQAYDAQLADIAGLTYAQGDVLYYNGTNIVNLGPGTSGHFLKTQGAGANPVWAAASATLADGDYGDITVSSSGAAWAIDADAVTLSKISGVIAPPQGRLTLTSNTPVMNADATAQGTIYYAPYVGSMVPIYSGSLWNLKSFSQLSLTLNSTDNLLNNLYDIFVFNNSGTLTLGTGPAWTNTATITVTIATPAVVSWASHGLKEGDPVVFTTTGALPTGITAGTTYYVSTTSLAAGSFRISTSVANAAAGTNVATSGSQSGVHTGTNPTTIRGTGAGTTELELKDGIWTNKNAITLRAGGSSLGSISANRATYLGTAYMTANGQTGMVFKPSAAASGSTNILGLFNAYNRVLTTSLCRDSTASWTYGATAWRAMNGSTVNRVTYVDGLAEASIDAARAQFGTSAAGSSWTVAMNRDSTSANPGVTTQAPSLAAATSNTFASVRETWPPALGLHYIQAMEAAITATNNTFYGAATGPPVLQYNGLTVALQM